jgi:hypothetical protein
MTMSMNDHQETAMPERGAQPDALSRTEVAALVVMERLARYNAGEPCGAAALRQRLHDQKLVQPLPLEQTISALRITGQTHLLNLTGMTVSDTPARRCEPTWTRSTATPGSR